MFYNTELFIDNLCALNDGGKFGKAFREIYPAKLELKVEHNGSHATFVDLDISTDKGKLIYKMFDKRDAFISLECHQLQVTYHLSFFIFPLCQDL